MRECIDCGERYKHSHIIVKDVVKKSTFSKEVLGLGTTKITIVRTTLRTILKSSAKDAIKLSISVGRLFKV